MTVTPDLSPTTVGIQLVDDVYTDRLGLRLYGVLRLRPVSVSVPGSRLLEARQQLQAKHS